MKNKLNVKEVIHFTFFIDYHVKLQTKWLILQVN